MPNPPRLPPKLIENKSDERQTFELINAMRNQMLAGDLSGGSGQFSTRFSTNGLGSDAGTPEVAGQVETPVAIETFKVQFGAQALDAGLFGTIQIVIGGGDWTPDGTVLATIHATSADFVRVEFDGPDIYANTAGDTRIKLVLTSSLDGNYVKVFDQSLVLV